MNFGTFCLRFVIQYLGAHVIECYAQHVIQSINKGTSSPLIGGQIKCGRARSDRHNVRIMGLTGMLSHAGSSVRQRYMKNLTLISLPHNIMI